MEENDVISTLKLDTLLISEALRRLTDGTSCLEGEEKDFINELFEKASQAVTDHIEIEEEGFLPRILGSEATLMRTEHTRMHELFAEARHAISHERALSFKVLVEALKVAMIDHEKIESQVFKSLTPHDFELAAMASVRRRISNNLV